MSKSVIIGQEAREKIKEGVDILANAVKATLGPRGRHAAIERRMGPPIITKDGVTVARYISLDNHVQNMGAQLIKSVASDANSEAGDGTTTATVLAQEIYGRGLKYVSKGHNPVLIRRGIDVAVQQVISRLKENTIQVNDEKTLCHVATISANNDEVLGAMISEAISAVGNDGVVSVEEATGNVTEVKYTDGLKLDRGWLNEAFITNMDKNTCEFDGAYVLLYDEKVQSIQELVKILNEVIEKGRPILMIFRDIVPEAMAHIVLNRLNNSIKCCVIKAPGFGSHRRAFMEDIAVLTQAKLFTNSDGQGLRLATLNDLGIVSKVTVSTNSTSLVGGTATPEAVQLVVDQLKNQLTEEDIFPEQKAVISDRVSRLTGGVAVFRVGATSESEMREKKDRVEDAINAVKSALSEGVVPGGGCALLHCLSSLDELDTSNMLTEELIGVEIIKESISSPFRQILDNSGIFKKEADYREQIIKAAGFSGFDALKMEYVEDMLSRGIVDPTKVVRSALEHAASASGTLLTTEVSICEMEKDNK